MFSSRNSQDWEEDQLYPVPTFVPTEEEESVESLSITDMVKANEEKEEELDTKEDTLTTETSSKVQEEPENPPQDEPTTTFQNFQTKQKTKTIKAPQENKAGQLTLKELMVVLVIFCLILLVLSYMWDNLLTTFCICGITLPVLRYFGKI